MRLEGKAKIKKVLSQKTIRFYIVESYYEYDESHRMILGEYYEEEIREAFMRRGVKVPMEEIDDGIVIFMPSRDFKILLLTEIVLELTKPNLSKEEMKIYMDMVAKGEIQNSNNKNN